MQQSLWEMGAEKVEKIRPCLLNLSKGLRKTVLKNIYSWGIAEGTKATA